MRSFCDMGCSVIHAWQEAVEAEWQVQGKIIRDAPIPHRLQRLVGRRRRALDARRTALRTRRSPSIPPWVRLTFRPGWVPLLLAPVLFVLSYAAFIPSLSPPARLPGKPAISLLGIQPMVPPVPVILPKLPDLIPPGVPELSPLPPETDLARGPTWERKMALTFDGGAEANTTVEILDGLKSMEVRATIFLTGGYIDRYPDLVRRMVREGHEIGNHTFSHSHLTTYALDRRQDTLPGITKEFVHSELRRAARLFEAVTGVPMSPYWRAPYGEHNPEIRRWAAEIGYLHVGWTRDLAAREDLDSRDWVADPESPIYYRAEEVRERILTFGQGRPARANGGIILLHLGTRRRQDRIHDELPAIVHGLRAQGYDLVPISELHRALALGEGGKESVVAAER